ncbi:MAG TPA: class I SAM-dependent methyltransferase [Syntrophales bacterium]|nr:class I SAM-dependent methyltransferase [Syntrophales bacterium]
MNPAASANTFACCGVSERSVWNKKVLDAQQQQWQDMFLETPEMFGTEPSHPARKASELFKREGKTKVLELGSGQGRDTLFFAQKGFTVHALDYSNQAIEAINRMAHDLGLSQLIITKVHDVRNPLPFGHETFDASYSHMLFCMALTTAQLQFLSEEIRRVLKQGGISVYTVRHTGDAHYKTGIYRGEDMYEVGDFIVHFFSREKVELLAKGYEIIGIDEFEEGKLPRRLFLAMLRKK